jgi:LuxR family maltose regulon positive regulatory protein
LTRRRKNQRAQGQLVEIRAADLRFTPGETGKFFERVMGVSLSPEAMAALEARVEGWPLGVQLVGLATRERENVEDFMGALSGEHRFVID